MLQVNALVTLGGSEEPAVPRPVAPLTALLLISALGAPAASAACPQRPEQAVVAARDVIAAFTAQSPTLRRTDLTVSCLSAVPTPAQSAMIYSANAMIQAQLGDETNTLLWLHAMVEANPAAQLSPSLAPPEHPLFVLYAQALERPPSTRRPAPIPRNYTLWVDGVEAQGVPVERPALVVLTDRKGEVVWSDLVEPGADLKGEWGVHNVGRWSLAVVLGLAGGVLGYAALVTAL